jgi:hypothetical protein
MEGEDLADGCGEEDGLGLCGSVEGVVGVGALAGEGLFCLVSL